MLAEITVEDADANRAVAALFVRCRRDDGVPSTKKTKSSASPLLVDILEAQHVWRTRVTATDKPMALDCSPEEYLSTLSTTLSGVDSASAARFQFRWSRKSHTLTLMEQTGGLAMKYAALTFTDQTNDKYWPELLHSIVDGQATMTRELAEREARIRELEALAKDKDALLEQALDAKQQAEDALVEGFCAVLNAKKDEIQRLQTEVAVANNRASMERPAASLKAAAAKRKTLATGAKRIRSTRGAKIKQQSQEEDESDDNSSQSSQEHGDSNADGSGDDVDDGDDAAGRKRARQEAIGAYSRLPETLRPATQRICSSDDVLSDLDTIMKREVEANEAEQQPASAAPSRARKLPPKPSKKTNTRSSNASKSVVKPKAKAPSVTTKPAAAATVDSDEEDVFDMLG